MATILLPPDFREFLRLLNSNEVEYLIIAPGAAMGNPSAVLWRNGAQIADLNGLAPDSPLILLTAFGINDAGEIVGFGFDPGTGNVHGFLATPCNANSGKAGCANDTLSAAAEAHEKTERPRVVLSENARKLLLQRGLGRHWCADREVPCESATLPASEKL